LALTPESEKEQRMIERRKREKMGFNGLGL